MSNRNNLRALSIYALHAFTIFLSAFLVFQIQPMVSKSMLPFFGGSVSVWATSLLFFTTALSVGYFYVYLITKTSIKRQSFIHSIVLIVGLMIVGTSLILRSSLMIDLEWTIDSRLHPSLVVTLVLLSSVGLPYVILASTTPLVQSWYSTSTNHPYKLYAISNAGSFIALLSYPLVFERVFALTKQQYIWAALFGIFVISCLIAAVFAFRTHAAIPKKPRKTDEKLPWISWLSLSAFPTFMLVAITTSITQKIAPIPLLWIVPLAIYLLSFVIAFNGLGNGPFAFGFLTVSVAALFATTNEHTSIGWYVLIHICVLFAISITFHAKVYEKRPSDHLSSLFYLITSIGGALGSFAGSIVPPLIFNDVYELGIGLTISAIFIAWNLYHKYLKSKLSRTKTIAYATACFLFITISVTSIAPQYQSNIVYSSRNFYGLNQIAKDDDYIVLVNNQTAHGIEALDPQKKLEPVGYYSSASGIGIAFNLLNNRQPDLNVGIVGLGSGTLASYCDDDDKFTYYEIDRDMKKIAQDYFSFLEHCKNVDYKFGDGRVLLDEEDPNSYDLLVIDAFSGGSIPTHLLTKEAISIYLRTLKQNGVIALHVSNKYLDLGSIVKSASNDMNLDAVLIKGDPETEKAISSSSWILVSRNELNLDSSIIKGAVIRTDFDDVAPWTDEKTDIVSIFRPSSPSQ